MDLASVSILPRSAGKGKATVIRTRIKNRPFLRAANYLLLILALGPIALVAWYVTTYANSAPVGDQWWDVVYIAVKTRLGILTSEDIFTYYRGHRHVTIRLLTVISTYAIDYDVSLLRFAAFVTALLNLGLAALLFTKTQTRLASVAVFLFSVVLFTLHDQDNWTDYHFSTHQQMLFFVLSGLLALQRLRPGWLPFGILIVCAVASSFSYGFGVAAWMSFPVAAFSIPAYRRAWYVAAWLAALILFMAFYTSDYAISPSSDLNATLNLVRDGPLAPIVYLFQYLARRFEPSYAAIKFPLVGTKLNIITSGFAVICTLMMAINFCKVARSGSQGLGTAALWGSLALLAIGGGILMMLGQDLRTVPSRYSVPGDGFWVAFIALSLLVLGQRPPRSLAMLNVMLLIGIVVLTMPKNVWSIYGPGARDKFSKECDECVLDTPLNRLDCFRGCFKYGEEQSVYHLAALRLSVFRHENPQLVLPKIAPVLTDMPHRWLSVFVRDYMLAGLAPSQLFSIAPVPGTWPRVRKFSPFYRGEWSTDILPRPLTQSWTSPRTFTPVLPTLVADQPLVWYLNTPETEANLPTIKQAFSALNYVGQVVPITNTRYGSARFSLWCFERRETNACAAAVNQH